MGGMRLAVIGAGAVGSLVGGLLARAGEDVTLIGRRPHVDAVKRDGLRIDGVLGPLQIRVGAKEQLDFEPDVALLTVKTQAVAAAAREIRPYVAGAPVDPTQRGAGRDEVVATVCD